jgi:hypothetical protein
VLHNSLTLGLIADFQSQYPTLPSPIKLQEPVTVGGAPGDGGDGLDGAP